MKTMIAAAAAALFAPTGAARAEEPPGPDAVSPLVVTATRIPTPRDEVGSSVSLITAAQIADHQWRTLPEALAEVPGLNLVQTGGPGGVTSAFIRGANGNQTKVLLDGVEVNDPSQNAAFDFGQVQTAGIAKVEVLRGPQSSLYGADALGGVVAITTREGQGPARLASSLEAGSFATFNQTVGLAGASGAFHFALDVAHFHAGDTPVTPLHLLAPGEARIGDGYDNLTAGARLGLDLTPTFSLGLTVRAAGASLASTGEDFAVFPAVPDAQQTRQQTRQLFIRGEGKLVLAGGKLQNLFGVGFARYRTTIQAPDDGFGLPPTVNDRSQRANLDWQATATLTPTVSLVAGIAGDFQRLDDSPVGASQSDVGGFAEIQARAAPFLTFAASVRDDSNDHFGAHATWRLAPVVTLPGPGTLIRGSVGTGFKAPTLTQLFVSFPGFGFFANPGLRPETSLGYDIGFEQPLLGRQLRLGATWFHNAIDNLIATNAASTSWANIGRATSYGVESFAALTLGNRLALRADYTWTVARDDIRGQALLRRPASKASLTGTWRPARRWTLSAVGLYVGSRVDGNRDFSIPRLTAPPYATVSLAGAYDLGHGLTAFARVANLFDRHYEDPVGFDKPGVGAFAGVRLNLGVDGS